jgi:hypothetical protein
LKIENCAFLNTTINISKARKSEDDDSNEDRKEDGDASQISSNNSSDSDYMHEDDGDYFMPLEEDGFSSFKDNYYYYDISMISTKFKLIEFTISFPPNGNSSNSNSSTNNPDIFVKMDLAASEKKSAAATERRIW